VLKRNRQLLEKGYLRKKGAQWRFVSLFDLAVMMYHIALAKSHKEVGFEDANNTYDGLKRRLNKNVFVDPSWIESGLWACNMLDELKLFKHPEGLNFDDYLKEVIRSGVFDKTYNTVTFKKGETT
jgi:hypothetical protein